MNIQLRFFASVRETLGASQEALQLPPHVLTIGELRSYLRERGGFWQEALAAPKLICVACNQQMASDTVALSEGCEVAFFPPVTGG